MRAVNLIPDEQRGGAVLGAGRSEGVAYVVPLLLGGLALLAFLYGSARHQISSRTAKAAAITAQENQIQSEASRLAPYTSFITLREQREADVAALVNSRFDWAHGLHELGRVLPTGVWLTSITGSIGSSASTSATSSATTATGGSAAVKSSTPPGSIPTFSLSGCAPSQSEVALTLDRLRLIDGVSAVTLSSSGQSAAQGAAPTAGQSSTGSESAECKTDFSAQLTFEALPSSSAVTAATAPAKTPASDPAGAHDSGAAQ
jgi:Tfp pilus assembly protein PilN